MRFLLLTALIAILFPTNLRADFGFHAGSHLGYGRLANEDDSIADRGVSTFDLQFMPGYRLGIFMPGLLLDYRFIGQLGKESEYGYTDYGGRATSVGLGATMDVASFKMLVSYDFRARFKVPKPDGEYKGKGFHIMFGYLIIPQVSIDFAYTEAKYDVLEVGHVESLISNNRLRQWSFAMGASYSY